MDYSVDQFDFYLPEELIAQSPSEQRDDGFGYYKKNY